MLWMIDLVLGCARQRKARGRRHILSLCARGCAPLLLLVTHRFLAAFHLWSQPWPLRETLTQWVYQSRSLFTWCIIVQVGISDIQRLYEKSSSVITLRAHSKLKGTVHWWMSIVIICFCTVAAQNRFDFHYFFCGVQKEVFSTMSMLLLSMSWKWIVAITVKI